MSRYLLFLLLGIAMSGFSQKVYLPVQVNQQWTFLEVTRETTSLDTTRLYDRLGDVNLPWFGRPDSRSDYYQVEKNGQLGLVTADFEPVLQPAWREIHPISDQYFLVAAADGYRVVDRQGKAILPANDYQAVRLPDLDDLPFFMLQQNGKWGVRKRGQSQWSIPPDYTNLEYLRVGRDGFFKAQGDSIAGGSWQVLDWSGVPLSGFSGHFEIIEPAGRNYLIVQQSSRKTNWSLRDLNGKELLVLPPETVIMPLNEHLFAYREKGSTAYTVIAMRNNITPLVEPFDHLQVLDDDLVFYRSGAQSGFIPATGRLQPLDADLKVSQVAGTGYLLRMKGGADNKWGLYAPREQELLLDFQYDSIAPFQGRLARIMQAGKIGVINETGTVVAAPRYERIPDIHPGTKYIYAYWKDSVQIFALDPDGHPTNKIPSNLAIATLGPEKHHWPQYQNKDEVPDQTMPTTSRFPVAKETTADLLREISPAEGGDTLWVVKGQSFWQPQGEGYRLMQWKEVEVVVRERSAANAKKKKKKRKATAPAPKRTELVMKWVPEGAYYSSLKRATSVDWTLAYQDKGGLVSNELTNNGRTQFSARRISVLRGEENDFLTEVEMIGIRLSDFADGLPYAAFCDPDGKFGLVSKTGEQLLNAAGAPLRFTYISKSSEGLMQACHPSSAFSQVGLSLTELYREFHMEPVNSTGNYISEVTSGKSAMWGYYDLQGKMVFPYVYDLCVPFDNGCAVNRKEGKWGVLSAEKGELLPFEFDGITREQDQWKVMRLVDAPGMVYYDDQGRRYEWETSARLAMQGQTLFRMSTGEDPVQYGFVDREGLVRIFPQFDYASEFQDGLATVRQDRKWFFINQRGETVIELDTSIIGIIEVGQFSEGLCPIRKTTVLDKKPTRKYGYLNTDGQLAIAPQFDGAASFRDGLAVVDSLNLDNYRPGQEGGIPRDLALIDKTGKRITGYDFRRIGAFNAAGFAEVIQAGTGKHGVLGKDGKLLTGQYYERVKTFPGGMGGYDGSNWRLFNYKGSAIETPVARITDISYFAGQDLLVKDGADSWSHLVITEEEVVTRGSGFRSIQPFDGAFALARKDGQTFLYGRDQTQILPKAGQVFRSWSNQRIGIKEGEAEYYANLALQRTFPRSFESAAEFNGNGAIVGYQGKTGAIDRNGLFILPPKFAAVSREKEGYLKVPAPARRYGLYAEAGEELVPARYDRIERLPNGVIRMEYLDEIGYYRPDGKAIWEPAAE